MKPGSAYTAGVMNDEIRLEIGLEIEPEADGEPAVAESEGDS